MADGGRSHRRHRLCGDLHRRARRQHHKTFQLGGRELGQLEHLAAIARETPEKPYFGTPPPSTVYIIYVRHHTIQVGTGHEPRRLTPLTGMLNGLIDQYS